MKEIVILKNDAGQRIDKFIKKRYKTLPASMLYKAIRKKDIKLNGKRCKEDDILKEGDVLKLYIKDELLNAKKNSYEFMKAPNKLDILYEDENIIAINKKAGIATHPDKDYHFDCALHRLHRYLYENNKFNPEKENSFSPAFVNRLDRNTSGILLAAKNAQSLRILNEKIKLHEVEKYYLCEVWGSFADKSEILTAYLMKNESKNKVFISSKEKPGYKEIITEYKVIQEKADSTLLEIHLITGRTHQIRAHMAHIGHPLLGERKYTTARYKNKEKIYKHQALCAYKIIFNFSNEAEMLSYLNKKEISIKDKDISLRIRQ